MCRMRVYAERGSRSERVSPVEQGRGSEPATEPVNGGIHVRKLLVVLTSALLIVPLSAARSATVPVAVEPGSVASPELVNVLSASAPTDRLVVFVHAADVGTARAAVATAGLGLVTTWDTIGVAVGVGTPAAVRSVVAQPGVTYVEPDQPLVYFLDTSHTATRGAEARTAAGNVLRPDNTPYDGTGVTIVVNDSGVDGTHEMFTRPDGTSKVERNVRELCAEALCSGATVEVPNSDIANGHGTHVAGIAGGFERTAVDGRIVRGAAPGATLAAHGSGAGLSILAANAGLNWVLQNRANPCGDGSCPPIRVVNNSWGSGGGNFNPGSATSLLVNQLVDAGVVVVFAAGNGDATGNGGDGSTNMVNPHAQNPKPGVIGVANYDDINLGTRDGGLDTSSSRGKKGEPATYPDISAPGSIITSACTYALPICRSSGDVTDPNYAAISGTSMAAPHIAGIVAVILEANPALTPAQVEDVVEDTAYKFGDPGTYEADVPARNSDNTTSFDKGHGLVDVVAALGDVDVLNRVTPAGPVCPGAGGVLDVPDDATDFVFETGAPSALSEPGLDILSGGLTTDAGNGDLTFRITVKDLDDVPPPGSTGEFMRFYFGYQGVEYLVTAARTKVGPQLVNQSARIQESALQGQVILANLAVTFDEATDTVSVVVPDDAIHNWKPAVPVIVNGDLLTGLKIFAQRRVGLGVGLTATPTADTANGACPYVVGS